MLQGVSLQLHCTQTKWWLYKVLHCITSAITEGCKKPECPSGGDSINKGASTEIKHCATRKNERLYKLRWKGIQSTVKQSSEQGVEHGKIWLSNRSEIWFSIINFHLNILPIGDEVGNRRWMNIYVSFLRVLVFWATYVLYTHIHTHTDTKASAMHYTHIFLIW